MVDFHHGFILNALYLAEEAVRRDRGHVINQNLNMVVLTAMEKE